MPSSPTASPNLSSILSSLSHPASSLSHPASSLSHSPRIQRLSEQVRNRIAAGEVVQRPCNALKELLENSLDAGGDTVSLLLHRGGMRLLQIADNGQGIAREDLALLCERHATSKLRDFSDLRTISTYGFRGEALASISMVAYLTVTSKTRHQQLAYRAEYIEGRPVSRRGQGTPPPPATTITTTTTTTTTATTTTGGVADGGHAQTPAQTPSAALVGKAMAGSDGTIIRVENMFYNTPARRDAMKRDSEELKRCVDVAKRYALHNHLVSISLRRENDEVIFQTTRSNNQRDTVRALFSREVERELLEVHMDSSEKWKFKARALVSGTSKGWRDGGGGGSNFILFINNRLVQHKDLKKSVLAIYEHYLRRGDHPWVYISLHIDPHNVDVNIHPTKNEVAFNPSDIIIQQVCGAIREKLLGSHQSRTFYPSSSLPIASTDTISNNIVGTSTTIAMDPPTSTPSRGTSSVTSTMRIPSGIPTTITTATTTTTTPSSSQRALPQYMVRRTDADQQGQMELYLESAAFNSPVEKLKKRIAVTPRKSKNVALHSVLHLRKAVEENCNSLLRDLFRKHTYVGWINPQYSLVQHLTKLYLVKNYEISRELSYQMVLERFHGMKKIKLSEPINVQEMILCMLLNSPETSEAEEAEVEEEQHSGKEPASTPNTMTSEAQKLARILTDTPFTEMLNEYFSIQIQDRELVALPQVFDNHVPPLHRLPEFLHGLSADVNWQDEQCCFDGIARHLASFYALSQKWELDDDDHDDEDELGGNGQDVYGDQYDQMAAGYTQEKVKWVTQHVVFPTAKMQFRPPQEFARDYVVREIACLSQLYKVFERC